MRARSLIGVVAALGLLLGACSSGDDTNETPVLKLSDEGPGTCLQVPDDLPAEVAKLPVIECSVEHTHEIYAVVDYASTSRTSDTTANSDVFPGQEALNTYAEQVCVREFEPYVGVSAFDSTLAFTWLTPTLSSWNDHDDRAVLCVLNNIDRAPMVGSKKGSGQ